MLKAPFASLQSASLSQPVTYSRKSTAETDVTQAPAPQMIPAAYYQMPMMYPHMAMAGQPTAYANPMAMQPGMAPMAAPVSPANMSVRSISPSGEGVMSPLALQLQYYTSTESLYQMAQAGTPIVPAPAQPNAYSQQAMVSIKPADQMNAFETHNWVRNVCEVQGWAEANAYAHAFYEHGVTGIQLAQLNIDDLEQYLGIEKLGHRQFLMSRIRAIYPYALVANYPSAAPSTTAESVTEFSEADSEQEGLVRPELQMLNSQRRRSMLAAPSLSKRNLLSHDNKLESMIRMRPQLIDESSCASVTSNNSMTSYVSSAVSDTTVASSINGDRRCKLTLTMDKAPACNTGAMLAIRQTFSRAGFDAHPRVSEKFSNKFIVIFSSDAEAKRALSMKDQFGYDLSEFTETRKKVRGPRPTPSNPQQYMVLHHARMRKGKSMKSSVLGFVEKGEVFWVNQIKGKRARLIERTKEGDENLGWVSLRNNAGYQLMAPFHE